MGEIEDGDTQFVIIIDFTRKFLKTIAQEYIISLKIIRSWEAKLLSNLPFIVFVI